VILDDPYTDPHHARIIRDEAGALVIEDLGSVNGILVDGLRRSGRTTVVAGSEMRLGRTLLRFRDRHEAMTPALVDDAHATHAPRASAVTHRVSDTSPMVVTVLRPRWGILIAALAACVYSIYAWLENTERTSAGEVFGIVMVLAVLGTSWAGAWAVASRVNVHRFNFRGHVAIVSAASIGALVVMLAGEWLVFLFPGSWLPGALTLTGTIGLFSLVIAGHLALASAMPRQRLAKIGAIVAGVLLALMGGAALTDDDTFSDVPSYTSVLKPLGPRWIPTTTIDEFADAMKELKADTDSLVVVPVSDTTERPEP
jgi:hypothetical protein